MAVVLTVVAGTWDLAANVQKYEVYGTYLGSSFRDWRKPSAVIQGKRLVIATPNK